ncbi:MAG: dihydrofolate reductase, partial [Pseudomonadota bacterium]
MPRVTLIAAVARNGVIGRAGAIPWRIPGDLARFKRITMGHPVIMGRRTWESLGRPLPGRRNIVISRTPGFAPAGAEVFASLGAALAACADA